MIFNYKKKLLHSQDNNYKFQIYLSHKLGQGGFGQCYLGYDQIKNKYVAIKIINNTINRTERNQNKFLSKISNNQNIIQAYNVHLFSDSKLYIIMEYCNTGTLKNLMEQYKIKNKKFKQAYIIQIMKDILNGYKDLVESGLVHQDLKPSNILIHQNLFKIGDFGLTCNVGEDYRKIRGTKNYIPLQKFKVKQQNRPASHLCDIYSMGIILFQLIYQSHPYKGKKFNKYIKQKKKKNPNHQNKGISNMIYLQFLENASIQKPQINKQMYSQDLIDFVDRMISKQQKFRPDFNQVYNFFISKYSERQLLQKRTLSITKNQNEQDIYRSKLLVQQIKASQYAETEKIITVNELMLLIERRRSLVIFLDKLLNPINKQLNGVLGVEFYLKMINQKLLNLCYYIGQSSYQYFKQMKKCINKRQIKQLYSHHNQCIINLLLDDIKMLKTTLKKQYIFAPNMNLQYILFQLSGASSFIFNLLHSKVNNLQNNKAVQNITILSKIQNIKKLLDQIDFITSMQQSDFESYIISKYFK